jgi:uncharacterized protein (TIGR02217 family)
MTASFHEVQFPPAISYGAVGGPGFLTTVLSLASGFEQRNVNWSLARATYDVAQGIKTNDEFNALLKFFFARGGKAYGFRFKDWNDYQLPYYFQTPGDKDPIPGLFVTDGATATFQIFKLYGDTGNTYTRIIKKPVSGTVLLWNNGVPTTDFTVDTTTGIITLGNTTKATTGNIISVSCQFDVPVRFDTDSLQNTLNDYNSNSWSQIPIIEIRQ